MEVTNNSVVPLPEWMQIEPDSNWDSDDAQDEIPGYSFYQDSIKLYFDPGPHVYYKYDEEGKRVNVDGVTTILDVINKPFLKQWAAKVAVEFIQSKLILPDGSQQQFSTEELNMLLHEAKGQHKVRLDVAGDIGHIAHEILEHSIQFAIDHTNGVVLDLKRLPTEETDANTMAINCANAALHWMREHNVRWIATERKIYSREYNFAGTEDGICIVDSCSSLKCCGGRVFKDRKAIADFKSSNQLSESYALQVAAYQLAQIEEFGEFIPDRWVLRLGKVKFEFEPWYLPADEFEADIETFLAALTLYRNLRDITERRRIDKACISDLLKAQRQAEKALKDEQERFARLAAREASKAETKRRHEAQKAHYKALRAEGMSPTEAKLLAYPKAEKSEPETTLSTNESSNVDNNSAHSAKIQPATKEEPFEIEWTLKL